MDTQLFWDTLFQISIVLTGFVSGGFLPSTINYLKNKFNLKGDAVVLLLLVISFLITSAGFVVDLTINKGSITPTTWGSVLLAIIINSQIKYKQLKGDSEE